jgi:thiol-disulfide isomerase/thioredoxin
MHIRHRPSSLYAALVTPMVLAGCGGGGGEVGPSDRSAYPAGPYGATQGDVIEALSFTTADGGDYGLADIFADPDTSLLLLSTAAGWCTACIEEQGALEELATTHGPAGLAVMVAVFEDRDYLPATPELAGAWQEEHGLTFPVVADPDFVLSAYYDSALTPMNMIVDVNTMTILRISTGWDPSAITAIIEARL